MSRDTLITSFQSVSTHKTRTRIITLRMAHLYNERSIPGLIQLPPMVPYPIQGVGKVYTTGMGNADAPPPYSSIYPPAGNPQPASIIITTVTPNQEYNLQRRRQRNIACVIIVIVTAVMLTLILSILKFD